MSTRTCVRAVLHTDDDEVLLVNLVDPQSQHSFWITPGGGIEDGETHEQALRRELFEETGLQSFDMGPIVWNREVQFTWMGNQQRQIEHFYWIRCQRFDASPQVLDEVTELPAFASVTWWKLHDIATSNLNIAPADFVSQVQLLLTAGVPKTPVVLG